MARYHENLWPESLGSPYGGHKECVYWLKREKIGLFRRMADDPAFEPVSIAPIPSQTEGMTWEGNVGQGTSSESNATFSLAKPCFVAAVRIRGYLSTNELKGTMLRSRVLWRRSGEPSIREENNNYLFWGNKNGRWEGIAYIADTIDQIKIIPGGDRIQREPGATKFEALFSFQIDDITLLVNPSPGTKPAFDKPPR